MSPPGAGMAGIACGSQRFDRLFQPRNCPPVGVAGETGCPWIPFTLEDVMGPVMSPPGRDQRGPTPSLDSRRPALLVEDGTPLPPTGGACGSQRFVRLFQPRNCPPVGVAGETGCPWIPFTFVELMGPVMSPPGRDQSAPTPSVSRRRPALPAKDGRPLPPTGGACGSH